MAFIQRRNGVARLHSLAAHFAQVRSQAVDASSAISSPVYLPDSPLPLSMTAENLKAFGLLLH